LRKRFEDHQAERYGRGEVGHLVAVTTDPEEYRRSRDEVAGERWAEGEPEDETGFPLRVRLAVARKKRGLSQAAVAKAFGVSQYLVSQWETGTEPDEDGRVRGKPIPAKVAPLVARWIETGQEPTEEELKEAKAGKRGGR